MSGKFNSYLIDSGADISIFKTDKINKDQVINANSKREIAGITNTTVKSFGTTKTELFFNHNKIIHEFHIVNKDFPIPTDAILGRDFLIKYQAILNYDNWTMSLQLNQNQPRVQVQIHNNLDNGTIFIPPRCEVIKEIKNLKLNNDAVVINKEIKPGIFIARTIISKNNPLVKIINTTSDTVKLENFIPETEDLNNFEIFTVESNQINREKTLIKELNTNETPLFVKNKLEQLCIQYSDIFALSTDKLTTNNFYSQKIKLQDKTPVYIKNYRTPHTQKQEINRQVDKMLKDGIIEPSTSNYNNPILLVPKKSAGSDRKFRLVTDFRMLNKKLIADKFPLPRIDDILDQLGRAKYFSVIDLASGFYQIPLHEDSRDITSFSTEKGSFRYTRLPFGLSIGPNSFARMMSLAFAGLTPEKAFLYMDDLIVIGCSEKHHFSNLKSVFETCRKFNLRLNPSKCKFFKNECTYLGHKITDKGILPDDSKYEVIKQYPTPQSGEEVKRWVAFTNYYRRFIPNYAQIAYPLNKLTRKNVKFEWSEECQNSFSKLKNSLLSPRILQYPDFSKQFIITTDASNTACGAVLSQEVNGVDLPIAYASRSFVKSELNKPTILKELLAIHWAIKYFNCYIYGTKFLIKTDHKPLIHLFSMKNPTSKLTRIRLDLEEYNFDIEYVRGPDNVCADALSRINIETLKDTNNNISSILAVTRSETKRLNNMNNAVASEIKINKVNKPRVYEALNNADVLKIPLLLITPQKPSHFRMLLRSSRKVKESIFVNDDIELDQLLSLLEKIASKYKINTMKLCLNSVLLKRYKLHYFKAIANECLKHVSIVLFKERQVITDDNEKSNIIKDFHNQPLLGGHVGQKRLLKKLRSTYRWKNMSRDVAKFVKTCHQCQLNKIKIQKPELLQLTPTPQKPFDIVCIDTIGKLPTSMENYSYAVTIQCELTKYVVIIPITNKEASTVAEAIVKNFILIYGPMKQIRTDLGTEYKNQILDNISKLLKIEHKFSTAYHSQSVGSVERNHRVLNEYLRSYIDEFKTQWPDWCQFFAFCYNTTPLSYHNYTPFELVFGHTVNLPNEITKSEISPIYNLDAYDKELKFKLQLAHRRAADYLRKAKQERKISFDRKAKQNTFKAGELVTLSNETRHKFEGHYTGPYQITRVDETNCTISNGQKEITVHKNRLRPYATK